MSYRNSYSSAATRSRLVDDAWCDKHLPTQWRAVQAQNFPLEVGMQVINVMFAGAYGPLKAKVTDSWPNPIRAMSYVRVVDQSSYSGRKPAADYIPDVWDEATLALLLKAHGPGILLLLF
jgi:hypothetical protein